MNLFVGGAERGAEAAETVLANKEARTLPLRFFDRAVSSGL